MASQSSSGSQDKGSLEKFVKILAMKSAQIIVQSRLGEKIKTDCNPKSSGNDWFNIAIVDQPDVLAETKKVLQISQHESIITRLPLCVEISLQTVEEDNMVLEVWSLAVQKDQCDLQVRATHAIYNRMGLLLKSLLSVTRSTPAYKLSRRQSADSYQIFYRIYIGEPQTHQLGDGHKQLRVGQLCTQIGTLTMAVAYRTKMTISPTQTGRDNTIMLKSDHFLKDISPKHIRYNYNKKNEKKIIDLDKPMRCGAFVDASRVKQYTEADFILPETPPFHWLLPKPKDDTSSLKSGTDEDRQSINSPTEAPSSADENSSTNANNNNNILNNNNNSKGSFESAVGPMNFRLSQSPKSGEPNPVAGGAAAAAAAGPAASAVPASVESNSPPASLNSEFRRSSRWSIRQTGPEDERLLKELHFPFAASNSPIGDLAKFYRECFNAPPLQEFNQLSNVISNVDDEEAANADDAGRILTGADADLPEDDVDDLTRQLEQFETSLPEFETLVTSLCQSVDNNSNS